MKIKKIILNFIVFWGLVFSFGVNAEEIANYQVNIQVNQDATTNIKEEILYDFGNEERHGIIRNIPYHYSNSAGSYDIRYENFDVKDENNNNYDFSVSNEDGNYSIKIGDADVTVTGQKTYIISYTTKRAITYFDDHDELYWNAIGTEWNVPIKKALITLDGFGINKVSCYYGNYGEQNNCEILQTKNTYQTTVENIGSNSGVTVVMGFNKGVIYEPTQAEKTIEFIKDNWMVAIPFIVLIFLLWQWFRFGRDPKGKGVIIAEYSPLPALSPIESKTVMTEHVDMQKIAAELIFLAIKKYIKIEKSTEKKLGIFESDEYVFNKLKEPDANLTDFQKEIMKTIFTNKSSASIDKVSTSELKDIPQAMSSLLSSHGPEMIYQKLTKEAYFPESPQAVIVKYIAFGIFVIFCSIIPIIIDPFFGFVNVIAIALAGAIIIFFGFIMPRKTMKGVKAQEYLLGLKKYIEVAEAERIKFHNAPAKNPEHFEELLPYAIIFGLEKEWAKKFENMNYNPSWYSGGNYSSFNAVAFASSMNNLNDTITQTMVTASSGGSGFSGGGAGGGFGGGGGGSW